MPHKDDPVNDPSNVSAEHNQMAPIWNKIQTVLDGTESMRAAGTIYTTQHEGETNRRYDQRVQGAILDNVTKLTLDSWVGRPFSDPVIKSDDLPEQLDEWFKDVDLQGHGIGVFARKWFKEGLAKRIAPIIVDHPTPSLREDGQPRTLADDREDNLRPFMVFVKPENMLFRDSMIIDGQEMLTHIRFLEQENLRVGFAEVLRTRIRVFDRILEGEEAGVFVSLWELREVEDSDKEEWVLIQPLTKLDIDEIPVVIFEADEDKTPLEDLADLNIAHFNSISDHVNVLTVARFPIPFQIGGALETSAVEIGPKKMWFNPDSNGRFGYLEHTGAAIAAGREWERELREAMARHGLDFLRKRPDRETATARTLDAEEATSPLQDATIRFNDSLQKAAVLMGKWGNVDVPDAAIAVSIEFGPEDVEASDLEALKVARLNRDLSHEDYMLELRRRAVLRDSFDLEENDQRLEKEQKEQMEREMEMFQGQPTDGEDIDSTSVPTPQPANVA